MLAWMLYAVAVGAVLGLVAHLVERVLQIAGRPARWVWLAAMLAALFLPFAAGTVGRHVPGDDGTAGAIADAQAAGRLTVAVRSLENLSWGIDERWLIAAWSTASSLMLLVLLLAAAALRYDRRSWRAGTVAGEPVLLSKGAGPAVVGTVRPVIVVPVWVLELDAPVQRLIVEHEREHLRAGDSRLLAAGLLLLVLLPWCLPLWWQMQRLRRAIETDCDARLLRAGAQPRAYAEALLAVARSAPALLPVTSMASSRATLELRIRAIVTRNPPLRLRNTVLPLSAAVPLLLAAAALPAPVPPPMQGLFSLRSAPRTAAEQLRADGSLPGDPGEARLLAALISHHGPALAAGVPPGSIVWFVVDRDERIRHTGVERGTEADVIGRLRSRYPAETSDLMLGFSGVAVGDVEVDVLWMLPQ